MIKVRIVCETAPVLQSTVAHLPPNFSEPSFECLICFGVGNFWISIILVQSRLDTNMMVVKNRERCNAVFVVSEKQAKQSEVSECSNSHRMQKASDLYSLHDTQHSKHLILLQVFGRLQEFLVAKPRRCKVDAGNRFGDIGVTC